MGTPANERDELYQFCRFSVPARSIADIRYGYGLCARACARVRVRVLSACLHARVRAACMAAMMMALVSGLQVLAWDGMGWSGAGWSKGRVEFDGMGRWDLMEWDGMGGEVRRGDMKRSAARDGMPGGAMRFTAFRYGTTRCDVIRCAAMKRYGEGCVTNFVGSRRRADQLTHERARSRTLAHALTAEPHSQLNQTKRKPAHIRAGTRTATHAHRELIVWG